MLAAAANPFALITRGPMIVRDLDVLAEAATRADVSVTFSVPTLDEEVWRRTEPGHRAAAPAAAGARAARRRRRQGVGRDGADPARHLGPPEQLAEVVRAAREAGACGDLGERAAPQAGHARALPRVPRRATGRSSLPEYERLYGSRAYLPNAEVDADPRARCASSPASTASATGAACALDAAARARAADARLALLTRAPDEQPPPRIQSPRACRDEITTLIVDDHEVVREGLRLSLSRAPHIRIVGEAADGAERGRRWRCAGGRRS